jgi:hypothetical protein
MAFLKLTIARTLPVRAKVVNCPLYVPSAFRCPMLIWMLAWSLAVISLWVQALQSKGRAKRPLVHEGMALHG